MTNKSKEPDTPDWKDAVAFFVLRVTDSAHLVWVLLALFFLALIFILTRNLSSEDQLKFIWSIGSFEGLAWTGWLAAFIEIPIARWAILRMGNKNSAEIKRLTTENEKARKKLKDLKQGEFDLKP